MAIIIEGFSSSDKVPGFVGETVFGAGAISLASIPLTLLLVGLIGGTGTLVPDSDVLDANDETTINTLCDPGTELARMGYAALRVPGVRIKLATPAPDGGASAAAATITISGSWNTSGAFKYRIGGDRVSGGITSTDSTDDVATAIAAAINAKPKLCATASAGGSTVTITIKTDGVRGNQYLLFQDESGLPVGATSALAGGSALPGGGVPFDGGAGVEDVTNLQAVLFPGRYHRIALAQNDSDNLDLWRTYINDKASPQEGRMEHAGFASNDTLSATASLAQTTLNDWRFQCLWLLNSETHPSELAAVNMGLRTSKEQTQPNSGYDGDVLPGCAPQAARSDWAQRATQQTALDEGVTPLVTNEDGTVSIVRAITTHSRNGTDPDYRTLDTAQAVVPDYVRDYLRLLWTTEYVKANPYVRSDPAPEEPEPPAGVAFPSRWNSTVQKALGDLEAAQILTETTTHVPVSEFDFASARIMSAVPTIPLPLNHQTGISIRGQQLTA